MFSESGKGPHQHSFDSLPSALYRQFFENAPQGFFIAEPDKSGGIEFRLRNPCADVWLGAQTADRRRSYAEEIRSAMRGIVERRREPSVARGLEREDTVLLDSAERHVKTQLLPICGTSGALSHIIGVISDISPQKATERLLSLRESEFRLVSEHVDTGIVRFDASCKRIYVNPVVVQAYGLPLSDILGKSPLELPGGQAGNLYEAQIRQVFRTGQYTEYSHEWEYDGQKTRCRFMLFPERLPDGEVGTVLVIARNFIDSPETLQRLHDGQQDFRAFVGQSPDAVACYNRDGECNYLNAAAYALCEELTQAPGFATSEEGASPVGAATRSAIRQVLASGEPIEQELAWSSPTGRPYNYLMRYVPKFSMQGEITSVVAIGRNIVGLKQAEQAVNELKAQMAELAAQREAAREAERQRIALEIHDELGQLLTALRFRLSLLRHRLAGDNGQLESSLQEALGLIDKASREVKQIASNARPILLNQGLNAALKNLVDDFSSHTGIAFDLRLGDRELPLDESGATAVFRIVQESLTNIARHADAQSAQVSVEHEEDRWHLTIADNGKGFDLSAPRRKSTGLAGIRERVMMLNGDLSIQSTPGRGTRLRITLQNPKK